MKLRYLFSTILASALMFVGCVQESVDSFDNIKLSETYLTIPVDGGSAQVKVTATEAWAFTSEAPEWLAIDVLSGEAGETTVTFTAEAAESGREAELQIKAGNNAQYLRVRQGSMLASEATCKEVIDGPDGNTFIVEGICTAIASDYYGNWYLDDGTGEIYIYGTKNADGEYDWASFGIEVGDLVKVEGPKKTYGTTIELVDVAVVKVTKSLIKLPKTETSLAKEAAEHTFKVAYKGKGAFVEVDAASDWITYKSMSYKEGIPSKLEPNPADTAIVTVAVAASELQKPREGKVVLMSYQGDASSQVVYTIKQMGHTPPVTAINTLTQANVDEKTYVRVEGNVAALSTQALIIANETGAIVAYYGKDKVPAYKIGNKIAIQGTIGVNNFGIQIAPDYDELLDGSAKVEYGTPVVYDGKKLNTMLKTLIDGGHGTDKKTYYGVNTEYATMTGELVVSGSYYNLNVEGAEKQASIYNPIESLKLNSFDKKNVVLSGYVFSVSCSKDVPTYVYMMVTSVEIDNVIYKESFAASQGAYTIDNKALDGLSYVWKHDASYGYMKASAYSGSAKAAESWLVSPEYDLAGQTKVYLSFDHILNHLKTDPRADHVSVLVKEKTASEWKELDGITWPDGKSWNAVNSGKIDLSAYAGKTIQVAFKYVGNTKGTGNTPTWEVYNVKLTFN